MKDFVHWLLSQNNSDLQIGLFDGWHFLYLFITFGGTLALSLIGLKHPKYQNRLQRIMAYLTIGLYIIDFFIMPLSDSYDGISAYKLPFNICTIMAVFAPFVQFNPKFAKLRQPVVTLSIAASVMWMCYPGTALGGQPPFCYLIFQGQFVGNQGNKFTVGGLIVFAVDLKAEKLVDVFDSSAGPGNLNGVADRTLHLA